MSGLPQGSTTVRGMSRIFTTSVASVYPHYVTKVEKKGRTKAELHQVFGWLTGFDDLALDRHLARAPPSRISLPLASSSTSLSR